jgi:hypothetical protein
MTLLGILVFIVWMVISLLILYGWFLIMYSAKTRAYSMESRGTAYANESLGLLSASAIQTGAVFLSTLQSLVTATLVNILNFLKYILISFLILTTFGIVFLEYHPEIMQVFLSAYNCAFIPILYSLPNLLFLMAAFIYSVIWPILSGIAEIVRYFTRELPIYLIFCSAISSVASINRLGSVFNAFAIDLSNIFNQIQIPFSVFVTFENTTSGLNGLDYGNYDFSQTFTEISGMAYFILYGFGKCSCSSGDVVWDALFSWLYTSNPNMTLGG